MTDERAALSSAYSELERGRSSIRQVALEKKRQDVFDTIEARRGYALEVSLTNLWVLLYNEGSGSSRVCV